MAGGYVAEQALLELGGAVQGDVFHRAGIYREQDYHFLVQRQRGVLGLLQHFGRQLAPGQLGAGGGVQIGGAELGEGRQLAVLRQVQAQAAGYPADGPRLRRAAYPRHRQPYVDRRTDAGVEQFRLQVNLPVGDRYYIGGDIRRNVAGLGFDDRQGGDRAAAVFLVQPRRPLQQAAVQVEHIAGVGFASGGAAQQQRHLPVSPSVLGQVIVDHQHIFALVHKMLGHRAAGVRGEVLERGRIRRPGGDHDGVAHRIGFL